MKIFISYRRQDSEWITLSIFNKLRESHFKENEIFKDFNTIKAGEDYKKTIEKNLKECNVLLVIMGKEWFTSCDEAGNKRLFKSDDLLCYEIATALRLGKKVIPVLVGGSTMPSESELPDSIRELSLRQVVHVGTTNFDYDIVNLAKAVRDAIGQQDKYADMAGDFARGKIDQKELVKPENNSAYAVVCMLLGALILWLNTDTAWVVVICLGIIGGGAYAFFLSRQVKGLWLDQQFVAARKKGKRVRLISFLVPGIGIAVMVIIFLFQGLLWLANPESKKVIDLVNRMADSTQNIAATDQSSTTDQSQAVNVPSQKKYVVTAETNIYGSPSFNDASGYTFSTGTELLELENENGFIKVQFTSPEGVSYYGWVHTSYLNVEQ